MLVIADEERAVAIAGVMGGANSEVSEETTSILLESANFNPASIHHTGRELFLSSEACLRFERGIRPELTIPALKRATQLIIQLAGGEAAKGVVDIYPGKREHEPILLPVEKVNQLLGTELEAEQIVSTLASLGFTCKPADSLAAIQVTVPYWRSDIHGAVDLIEEVARIIGYDRIPMTTLSQPLPRVNPEPILSLKQKIRESLVGYGFQEVITYSLTSLEMLNKLKPESGSIQPLPLRVANPMTAEQEYLRPNLRANLLAVLASNRRHEEGGIRLFELGKVYLPKQKDLPNEPEVLGALLSGPRLERWWQGESEMLDFFDAKGVVESLLDRLGVVASFEPSDDESLHPAKQAAIVIGDSKVGMVGEVHPKVLDAFDITETACLFEINVTSLLPFIPPCKRFQPIPRYPATVRDIALVVDTQISHQQVLNIIRSFPLVNQVILFDVYSGKPIPPGKKSLAYRISYQSPTHTLTDKEVNQVQQQILDKLAQELGATLRG
jgi:phenylalanyl-tRNA synthetase beta chain